MSMADYEEARALLADHVDEANFVGRQPEERVARAEKALAVRFPPTYRRFLVELGAGDLGGEELYGLFDDDFADVRPPGMVGVTLRMRQEGLIGTDLVVVYGLGDGSYSGIDTRAAGPDSEGPVVSFEPGFHRAGDDLEVIAPDFGTFFLDLVRAGLARL